MRILDKYLIKNFIAPFIYCLFTFTLLFVIVDLFNHLDEILRQRVPVVMLLKYFLYLTPTIFLQATPLSALLTTIYLLGTLNRHNEIVAMKASGINLIRIIFPIILLAIFFALSMELVNEKISPQALAKSMHIKNKSFYILLHIFFFIFCEKKKSMFFRFTDTISNNFFYTFQF